MDRVLVRNTSWMLTAQLMRVGLQALYFVVVAGSLGTSEYGGFMAVLAVVFIMKPFAALGSGKILIKHVARDRGLLAPYFGNALLTTVVTGSTLLLLGLGLQRFFVPDGVSPTVFVLVALSDLVFAVIVEIVAQAFQAMERLRGTGVVTSIVFIARAAVAFVMVSVVETPTAVVWSQYYCLSTAAAALVALVIANRYLERPRIELGLIRPDFREGLLFCVSRSGHLVNTNIDKAMLGNLSTLDATGIYSAAYRVIAVAMTPVTALVGASYARFFKTRDQGISASYRVATRMLPISVLYGALASVGVWITAPLLPILLGPEYADSVSALRWLSPLPLAGSLYQVAEAVLSGSGFQGARSQLVLGVALGNIALNLVLIPTYSWQGAAWSSIASEWVLALGSWWLVMRYHRAQQLLTSDAGERDPGAREGKR